MSLIFGAITPHPPILVPEVGGRETKKIKKTTVAMQKLTKKLAEKEPETLIIISPHGLIYPDRMNVCGVEKLVGNLAQFGAPQVSFKFENDLELAEKINQEGNKNSIETLLYESDQNSYQLDHGILVPLYFLTQKLERPVKLLPIAYSFLNREAHFKFGQIIQAVASKLSANIALIASGDLSHRLLPSAPAGYSPLGKEFDEKLIQYLKDKNTDAILNFDDDFVEEAGECGLRSILILLGALSSLKYEVEVLSYEGPFGVGYGVINFKLQMPNDK